MENTINQFRQIQTGFWWDSDKCTALFETTIDGKRFTQRYTPLATDPADAFKEAEASFHENWKRYTTGGWTHFILDPSTGQVEIGFSVDPHQRLRELQTTRPKVQLIGGITGKQSITFATQAKFLFYEVEGDWFTYSEEIRTYLKEQHAKGRLRFPEEIHLSTLRKQKGKGKGKNRSKR